MEEPPPFGIPNRIGNTCWFQSATQCIFREPTMRRRILEFDPATYQIRRSDDTVRAFELLKAHFRDLAGCNPEISNVDLVMALKEPSGSPLVDPNQGSGRDSHFAIEAYFSLFSALLGDARPGLHSFTSPMGDILSLRLTRVRPDAPAALMPSCFFILANAESNQAAMLAHLADAFFLPRVLVMRHDQCSEEMTHPDPVIELPEPIDYVAAGKVLEKCRTRIKYELYATVLYQGNNADHAIAFIKMADSRRWFVFNDRKVEEKGDDAILGDEGWLSSINWPALFFYRRL